LIASVIGGMTPACSYAPSTIEVNGDDVRRDPLEVRKATLADIVASAAPGIWFNDHIEEEGGESVFPARLQAWTGGHRLETQGLALSLGRSPDWLKMKNPACAAVKREAEEDWGR
jgi:bifunctional non-homologous end joining protein LigD